MENPPPLLSNLKPEAQVSIEALERRGGWECPGWGPAVTRETEIRAWATSRSPRRIVGLTEGEPRLAEPQGLEKRKQ